MTDTPVLDTPDIGTPTGLVRLDVVATALFAVVCALALALRHRGWVEALFVTVSLVLFAVGVVTSLVAYASAVERSRTADISVGSLFMLAGKVAPTAVKRTMYLCWAVQIVAAFVVGIVGATGLGTGQRNVLAFGALVPMLGVGLHGLWAVRHGTFEARQQPHSRPQHRKIG